MLNEKETLIIHRYLGLEDTKLMTPQEFTDKFKGLELNRRGYFRAGLRTKTGLELFLKHYRRIVKVYEKRIKDAKRGTELSVEEKYNDFIKIIYHHIKKAEKILKKVQKEGPKKTMHLRCAANLIDELLEEKERRKILDSGERQIFDETREEYENSFRNLENYKRRLKREKTKRRNILEKKVEELEREYSIKLGKAWKTKHKVMQKRYNRYQEIKKEIVQRNLRLVIERSKKNETYGLSLFDLIQISAEGLMTAVEKFDYKKGCRFSTYAYQWIRQKTSAAKKDLPRIIRIKRYLFGERKKIGEVRNRLSHELSRQPFDDEIADEMGVDATRVSFFKKIFSTKTTSLDSFVNNKDTVFSFFIGFKQKHPDYFIFEIENALSRLSERERGIINLRFDLNGNGGELTLDELGKRFKLTRERVRQIQNKALLKLRVYLTNSYWMLEGI